MRLRSLLLASSFVLATACAPQVEPPDGDDDDDTSMEDNDGDGFTPLGGDCNDEEDDVYPGAPELDDDVDNDCNGLIDDDLPTADDDGDGYSNVQGDCDDNEPLVNPGAVEVNQTVDAEGNIIQEGIDNDCDGQIDEGNTPCDDALGGTLARDFANAADLCEFLVDATWYDGIPDAQKAIRVQFGSMYTPHWGAALGVISTGRAVDTSFANWENPSPGASLNGIQRSHPDPQPAPGDGCGSSDPSQVQDYVGLTVTVRVPTNAQAMMFDFNFMSAEFPQWVCTSYDDTFLAVLDSQEFDGNISFDDAGRPVTINIGFFDVCAPGQGPDCAGNTELSGTGFEQYGGTGWLHTIAPVTPGETLTLTFHLFDEGDDIWDSLTLIDNFQWLGVPVDGPITVPVQVADHVHAELMRGKSTAEIRAQF